MKIKRVSKIYVRMFIYSNSKFKVTCKNMDFKYQYIRDDQDLHQRETVKNF